jgi:hypothetical protein
MFVLLLFVVFLQVMNMARFYFDGTHCICGFSLGELCVVCFCYAVVFVGHQPRIEPLWKISTKNFLDGSR